MKTHINSAAKESKAGLWGFKGQWAMLPVLAGGASALGIAFCQASGAHLLVTVMVGATPFVLSFLFLSLFVTGKPSDYVAMFGQTVWRKLLCWLYWRAVIDTPITFIRTEPAGKHPRTYFSNSEVHEPL